MRVQLKLSVANACLWNISIILKLLGGWIAGPRFACCNEIRELIFRFPLSTCFDYYKIEFCDLQIFVHGGCWCSYSAGFTSVHGETPSPEYAKMRRESLENKFGLTLGTHSSKSFNAIYRFGPFLALYRAAIISFHVLRLTIWQLFIQDMKKRAIKVTGYLFPMLSILFCRCT